MQTTQGATSFEPCAIGDQFGWRPLECQESTLFQPISYLLSLQASAFCWHASSCSPRAKGAVTIFRGVRTTGLVPGSVFASVDLVQVLCQLAALRTPNLMAF